MEVGSRSRLLEQLSPELVTKDFPLCPLLFLDPDFLARFARSNDKRQERSWRRQKVVIRLLDPDRFHLDEVERGSSRLIQPADRGDMLGARLGYDPYTGFGVESTDVGDQFPEVVMVALFQLVLNDDRVPVFVFSDQVYAETPGGLLSFYVDQRDVHNVIEQVVILLKPGSEVQRFVAPDFPERDALQPTDQNVTSLQTTESGGHIAFPHLPESPVEEVVDGLVAGLLVAQDDALHLGVALEHVDRLLE